jgi:hypothetical protein
MTCDKQISPLVKKLSRLPLGAMENPASIRIRFEGGN